MESMLGPAFTCLTPLGDYRASIFRLMNPCFLESEDMRPETMAVHAGWRHDQTTGAVAVPIYQTTAFQFDSAEHAADLFALKDLGNIYSRITNPTSDALEKRVAALDGGVAALAVASGQAASALAVQNLAKAGDNIVSSTGLYGGTWNLFANTLKGQGIEARFVDPSDPQAFARASDGRTRCWYAETLSNPSLNVFPIAEVAGIGRRLGIPLIMDNTAAPLIVRPFDHGAAVITYSATKYLSGHGTSIAGAIVDGGNFDWEAYPDRHPSLNTPDPSYHGAVWTQAAKALGPIAYILKARVTLLRDLGPAISPFNAFLVLQGLETLALRMRQHSTSASKIADWLSKRPEIAKVIHPAHMTGNDAELSSRYLPDGKGGLVGIELHGGLDAGSRFINALKLFYHVANIGDARSLAIHPASTTHSQLCAADQLSAGVSPGYVRLSIGLEHPDDLIADLDQALRAAAR